MKDEQALKLWEQHVAKTAEKAGSARRSFHMGTLIEAADTRNVLNLRAQYEGAHPLRPVHFQCNVPARGVVLLHAILINGRNLIVGGVADAFEFAECSDDNMLDVPVFTHGTVVQVIAEYVSHYGTKRIADRDWRLTFSFLEREIKS